MVALYIVEDATSIQIHPGKWGVPALGYQTTVDPNIDFTVGSNPKYINTTINHHEMTMWKGSNRIIIFRIESLALV